MQLILYSKPGCHLCEGLQEKLEQLTHLPLEIEVRDITTREDWFQAYQYEIPVLCQRIGNPAAPSDGQIEKILPRLSPRASVKQVEKMLRACLGNQAE